MKAYPKWRSCRNGFSAGGARISGLLLDELHKVLLDLLPSIFFGRVPECAFPHLNGLVAKPRPLIQDREVLQGCKVSRSEVHGRFELLDCIERLISLSVEQSQVVMELE